MHLSRAISVFSLLALLVAGWVGLRDLDAPPALDSAAPDDAFSAERAMAHVERIAAEPHPVGTAAHASAREYVVGELRRLGLDPEVHSGVVRHGRDRRFRIAPVHNVVARIEGTSGGAAAVMLASHYDSVPHAAGAADAASGVAAILESIRALLAGGPPSNDVIVLITDAEEVGLLGARHFCASHPWADDVAVVLNFEARGHRGASILFETSAGNRPLVDALRLTSRPQGSSVYYETYRRMPNDTDMTVFKEAGMAGMNFAFIGGLSHYHTPWDTPDRLDQGSLQHHGDYALTLARHFGDLDLASLRDRDDLVFFTLFGRYVVSYPPALGYGLVLIATLLLGLGHRIAARKEWIRPRAVVTGFLVFPVSAVLAGLVFFAIRAMMDGSQAVVRFVAPLVEDEERYMVGLLLLATSIGVVVLLMLRTRAKVDGLWFGALAWWWLLAVASAVVVPLGGYLIALPLIAAALGFCVLASRPRRQRVDVARAAFVTLAVGAGVLLLSPMVWGLFLSLRLPGGIAVVLSLLLVLGLATPVLLFATSHARAFLPVATGLLGFLVIAHTLLTSAGGELATSSPSDVDAAPVPPVEISVDEMRGDASARTIAAACRLPEETARVLVRVIGDGALLAVAGVEFGEEGAALVEVLAPADRRLDLSVLSRTGEAKLVVNAQRYEPPTGLADRTVYRGSAVTLELP